MEGGGAGGPGGETGGLSGGLQPASARSRGTIEKIELLEAFIRL